MELAWSLVIGFKIRRKLNLVHGVALGLVNSN